MRKQEGKILNNKKEETGRKNKAEAQEKVKRDEYRAGNTWNKKNGKRDHISDKSGGNENDYHLSREETQQYRWEMEVFNMSNWKLLMNELDGQW